MLAVSAVVGNTGVVADSEGKKILKAGQPMYGDFTARGTAFVSLLLVLHLMQLYYVT